ncbi:3-hydroxyacyl-CoA dehydrogenase NAD-binding domain-containing protein [Streptomyces canus]
MIGAGTIGLSWTALFAAHGLQVWVYDPRPDLAEAVREALTTALPP